jgi:AraC-like DNA-binding protein
MSDGAQRGIESLRFSTRDLAPGRRLPALQDLFEQSVRMEIDAGAGVLVEMDMAIAPGLRRARMHAPLSARVHRPSQRLADGDDTVCLIVNTGGDMSLRQGADEALPRIGDGMLLVYRRAAELRFAASTYLSMRVPITALGDASRVELSAGRCIPRESPALGLLCGYVTSLPERLDDPRLGRLAAGHVHDLMALALGTTRDRADPAVHGSVRAARLEAIKAALIQDPALTSDQLAARQGITPRYVQMLFESEGTTFSDFVIELRLELARRLLASARHAAWSITAIALESGFSDVSHFNRRFKRRYQMTPSDVRRLAGQGARLSG